MFFFSCLFIIAPVVANLKQLGKAMKEWAIDGDTRMIMQPWLRDHLHSLYIISIISGSAFSAIELCDSHLFQLSLFSMNLPKRQKQIFKNKRIFSVVLLENVPQFCLQVIYLLFFAESKNNNGSTESNIAFVAMFFSVLSLLNPNKSLSLFNTSCSTIKSLYLK